MDCKRTLRDLYCGRCRIIYHRQIEIDLACRNCGKRMLKQTSSSRFLCGYCHHRYLDIDKYVPVPDIEIKEYISSLERECPECTSRMTINPQNQELVCNNCGLVYEDPIYTVL